WAASAPGNWRRSTGSSNRSRTAWKRKIRREIGLGFFHHNVKGRLRMASRTILGTVAWTLVAGLGLVGPAGAADTYAADAAHSSTVFRVKHMNTSFAWGRFNDIAGTFMLDEANPSASQLDFQV